MQQNEKENQRKMKSYSKSLIILLIGIIFWILAYAINTYGQYLEWILFIISLPLIGYGYISLISQLELETACLIEGGVAMVIPIMLSSIFLLIVSGSRVEWGVLLLMLVVGIVSLVLGIYGYLKAMKGNYRIGKLIRIILLITLVIGIALSFATSRQVGY